MLGLLPEMTNTVTLDIESQNGTSEQVSFVHERAALMGTEAIRLSKTAGTSTQQLSDGLYAILGNDSSAQDFMYYNGSAGIHSCLVYIK